MRVISIPKKCVNIKILCLKRIETKENRRTENFLIHRQYFQHNRNLSQIESPIVPIKDPPKAKNIKTKKENHVVKHVDIHVVSKK